MRDLINIDWSKLPIPADDGAAGHLKGRRLPSLILTSTDGSSIDLSLLEGQTVLYAYPRMGRPDMPSLEGWDMIPGAKGCTPQSCSFRDYFSQLRELGVDHLFGLSTQNSIEQREAVGRLHLPFPLLSDHQFILVEALKLPIFEISGVSLLKRLTMMIKNGVIEHVFYPVFPPDRNAQDVIEWLIAQG